MSSLGLTYAWVSSLSLHSLNCKKTSKQSLKLEKTQKSRIQSERNKYSRKAALKQNKMLETENSFERELLIWIEIVNPAEVYHGFNWHDTKNQRGDFLIAVWARLHKRICRKPELISQRMKSPDRVRITLLPCTRRLHFYYLLETYHKLGWICLGAYFLQINTAWIWLRYMPRTKNVFNYYECLAI